MVEVPEARANVRKARVRLKGDAKVKVKRKTKVEDPEATTRRTRTGTRTRTRTGPLETPTLRQGGPIPSLLVAAKYGAYDLFPDASSTRTRD